MVRLLLALALIAWAPSAAGAFELPARAEAALERGRPVVLVRADPDGVSGLIQAAIDVAAPPEAIWSVITDCDLAPRMVESLKSCRIVERDPDGRWDVREHISKMTFLPPVRNVFRTDYDPPRLARFHRVGGDLKVFEGEWRLEPHGDRMRVFYESRASVPFNVPGPLARIALRRDVRHALLALSSESLARAR